MKTQAANLSCSLLYLVSPTEPVLRKVSKYLLKDMGVGVDVKTRWFSLFSKELNTTDVLAQRAAIFAHQYIPKA